MIRLSRLKRTSGAVLSLAVGASVVLQGCAPRHEDAIGPLVVSNTLWGPITIAVAPSLNLSGSRDFDRNKVADLMASELGHVDGITVIPVSRVLAVMARQGRKEVGSPADARRICEQLGADAILVFAVTEYDPYEPPVVGISAQVYGRRPRGDEHGAGGPSGGGTEPASDEPAGSQDGTAFTPLASTQQVFNAAHEDVARRVRRFAKRRGVGGSPFGWRLYLASQERYLRFCCAAVIRDLVPRDTSATLAEGAGGEEIEP